MKNLSDTLPGAAEMKAAKNRIFGEIIAGIGELDIIAMFGTPDPHIEATVVRLITAIRQQSGEQVINMDACEVGSCFLEVIRANYEPIAAKRAAAEVVQAQKKQAQG